MRYIYANEDATSKASSSAPASAPCCSASGAPQLDQQANAVDQFASSEWLLEYRPVAVIARQGMIGIAGCENERHAPRGECFCYGIAFVAFKIHIQHGDIENLSIDQGEGLIDPSGRGHGRAAVGKRVFNELNDDHFILDNEDMTTGKDFIYQEQLPVQEC